MLDEVKPVILSILRAGFPPFVPPLVRGGGPLAVEG